jgi:YVTN family beta-propeller protein
MKLRISGLPAIAAFALAGIIASAQALAQNAYITNADGVSVIDTVSNTVIATIPVSGGTSGVAVSPDGSKVYVANSGTNSVSVIATASNTVIATIPVGNEPMAFGIFIQPAPQFAGTPGKPNCHGQSVSASPQQYGGLAHAATVLGYSSMQVLQNAIAEYCAA